MKKKTTIISIISLVIILIVVANYFYLTPRASIEEQMEKDMQEYLFVERGYSEEEVLDIEINFDPWNETGIQRYNSTVYFADEPENDYGYMYSSEGEIQPAYFGNGKHNP